MGPSIAGRGKPRPLLAGVFRKACDYCVRSKRGCNGGKPCTQCIRRGHSCTYSQRRKSGPRSPRSRSLRPQQQQQQQQQQHSPARLGTRSSARRTAVSLASCPSPSRTASLSSSSFSSSSPSESSDGGDDSSDDEFDMETQQRPREQQQQQQQKQRQKRCRISGPEAGGGEGISVAAQQVLSTVPVSRQADDQPPSPSPSPFISSKASPRGDASAADAAAGPAVKHGVEPQAAAEPAVSSSPASSPSSRSPPRQLSPLTVGASPTLPLNLQRSSSLPSWAREASGDGEQQQQQTHRSSASVGAVPTSTSFIATDNNRRGDTSVKRVNQITMQPWEGGRPRSVTLINVETQQQQQQQQAQAYQVPAFAVPSSRGRVFVSKHSGQRSMPSPDPLGAQTQQQVATAAAAATATLATSMMLDGAGDFGGGALKDLEEEDDFACCPWRIPSLTRQGSLARVVAALGAERSGPSLHGVEIGFEGSFATAW